MSDSKPPLRIASRKSQITDGIGNFFGEYGPGKYSPRIDLRFASGWRTSIQYSYITEIDYTPLQDGYEDIIIYVPNHHILRIYGTNLEKLYEALHQLDVKWIREMRENEQVEPDSLSVCRLFYHRLNSWPETLDALEAATSE